MMKSTAGKLSSGKGKVYLVGAGPGDPELLSLKALKIIKQADVVLHDRLISQSILELIPRRALKIQVGKIPGHGISQREINELMIYHARKGKIVVRLKNGDPFLFGRGGEEAQQLRRAGIDFEVVPGVSSAIAVPAYAGIPLTHRRYSSSVAIVTGHEDPSKMSSRVDWGKLARSVDTIVILMGINKLDGILSQLMAGGLDPAKKVAIIEQGTTPHQRTILGTLKDIASKAASCGVKPPAVIVIGDVVGLSNQLAWFKHEISRI